LNLSNVNNKDIFEMPQKTSVVDTLHAPAFLSGSDTALSLK